MSSRTKISEKLLADLAVVWEQHGQSVLERLAKEEPGKLATIAYGLLPKDVFVSVEQRTPGNLDPEAWASLRRVLEIIEAVGATGDPAEVFAAIEEDLRARLAVPVGNRARSTACWPLPATAATQLGIGC
jgi:hypothetical protein